MTQANDSLNNPSRIGFDAASNRSATFDVRGFRTTYSYDALNRQTAVPAP